MTGFGMQMHLEGLEEVEEYTKRVADGIGGRIMQAAFTDVGKMLLRDAVDNAPKDTGRLADSLEAEVSVTRDGITATVFSNPGISPPVVAAVMEKGSTKRWWPPIAALQGWADRHGMKPFLVARAIATKGILGGKPGYQYMQSSLEKNEHRGIMQIARAMEKVLKK